MEEPASSRVERKNTLDLNHNIETKVSEMQEAVSCNEDGNEETDDQQECQTEDMNEGGETTTE